MYETPVFNENNEKILCEMGGKNAEMLMSIKVKQLSAGESFTVCSAANETAVLLLAGEVEFLFAGEAKCAAAPQSVSRQALLRAFPAQKGGDRRGKNGRAHFNPANRQ